MEFWSTILLSATIAAIAAMGLFLQIRNGQMNVGMAVFSGIGGYVSGWLSTRGGFSPVLSIPVAVAAVSPESLTYPGAGRDSCLTALRFGYLMY